MKFESESYHFHSGNCIWNCRLPKMTAILSRRRWVNRLGPNDGTYLHGAWSVLVPTMDWCLMAQNHLLNLCWGLVSWTTRNNFQWKVNQNTIFIHENAFVCVICQMAAICLNLNELSFSETSNEFYKLIAMLPARGVDNHRSVTL